MLKGKSRGIEIAADAVSSNSDKYTSLEVSYKSPIGRNGRYSSTFSSAERF